MKLTHYGTVSEGKLKISNRQRFDQDIQQLEGKRVEITIQKAKKSRSSNQNAYLWGIVYPCVVKGFEDVGELGITVDEVHTFLKDRFLTNGKSVIAPGTGEVFQLGNTTTTLSTSEMMDYIAQIQKFAAEMLGVVIPDPMPLMPV
jgi:hypothetical protein